MHKYFFVFIVSVSLLSGCMEEKQSINLPADTTKEDLIPDIEDYNKCDATNAVNVFTGAVSMAGKKAPELIVQIVGRISSFASCMNAKGASEIGYYDVHTNQNDELVVNFAAVGIGDSREVTDLKNLAICGGSALSPLSIAAQERACKEEFTIKSPDNEFIIVIVGVHDANGDNSCDVVKEAILKKARSLE